MKQYQNIFFTGMVWYVGGRCLCVYVFLCEIDSPIPCHIQRKRPPIQTTVPPYPQTVITKPSTLIFLDYMGPPDQTKRSSVNHSFWAKKRYIVAAFRIIRGKKGIKKCSSYLYFDFDIAFGMTCQLFLCFVQHFSLETSHNDSDAFHSEKVPRYQQFNDSKLRRLFFLKINICIEDLYNAFIYKLQFLVVRRESCDNHVIFSTHTWKSPALVVSFEVCRPGHIRPGRLLSVDPQVQPC